MTRQWRALLLLPLLTAAAAAAGAGGGCRDGAGRGCGPAAENEVTTEVDSQELLTQTQRPAPKPKSLSMLAEDHMESVDVSTPVPSNSSANATSPATPNKAADVVGKGRALNFTVDDDSDKGNVLSRTGGHDDSDLSDVSIDDNEDDHEVLSKVLAPKAAGVNATRGICEKGGLTYENGERLEHGCDSVCTCTNGKMDCSERCTGPFFRKGKNIDDPLCSAKDSEDPCCSVLVCAGDTETEPLEMCSYNNKTYNRGDSFKKDCSEVCTCEIAGKISCKPRCPTPTKTSDRCVEVPDPLDSCCKKVLCDVTLDDHNAEKDDDKSQLKVASAKYINSSAIQLEFEPKVEEHEKLPIVEVSNDRTSWGYYQMLPGGLLFVREKVKFLKLENSDDIIDIQNTELAGNDEMKQSLTGDGCSYKGKKFRFEEEYNDDCSALCVCKESGMQCLKLECPTYFGVDVLDPHCVEWETIPPDFKPTPPHCCPDQIRCKNNGSCDYKGRSYKNWDQIPVNITGCDKRCYCEMGKVDCQNACPPVTALPPPSLGCPASQAKVDHLPNDDCCMYWVCNKEETPTTEKQNQTVQTTTTRQTTDTSPFLGPFSPKHKEPSKVLGPLVVYTNEDDQEPTKDDKNTLVAPEENIYYHKEKKPQKPSVEKNELKPHRPETWKPSKESKPNKNNNVFVTPPTPSTKPNKTLSVYQENDISSFVPHGPTKSHIEIHGHGNPEELLQFIQQHPELSNYPSGSILEIHSVPPKSKPKQPFVPPGVIPGHVSNGPPNQLVPYLVPQVPVPHQTHEITLDQLLQEIHKTGYQAQNPMLPYPQNPPVVPNNGQVFMTPNGPISTIRPTASSQGFGGFGNNFGQPQDEVTVDTLEPVDPHTIRLSFRVPPVIVGLHGRVEVRYTHGIDDDFNAWESQVFAPPNDLIATPSLEFDLHGLRADTEYKIKITISLRDLHNTHSSKIYTIRTPKDTEMAALPPKIPIEPELSISDINATWVIVNWRKFTEYELQFIDGVQLRYKEIDTKIYTATPLIHRAVTSYTLENLKPNTKYELGIFFIPFPNQKTELHAENMLNFTTANEIDTYGFSVTLEITQIKSTSVEISWSGVPYPEDKYVNIYRAIYQSDSGKEDHSTFKIAKRDSPTKTIIMELKPGTRYRLWLEVYLTNGKIKTSNVQDFITKPRLAPALGASSQQDKLSRESVEAGQPQGDYYGPLVVVAILAAIAILSTLVLLLVLVRRRGQHKAAITPPPTAAARVSQAAYDNPTYKVEIQQETMGL